MKNRVKRFKDVAKNIPREGISIADAHKKLINAKIKDMSTKSTIILTEDNEHVYSDCSNQFRTKNEHIGNEISFEFSKKNIRIDANDDEDLCFSLDKDSEIFRFFNDLFARTKHETLQNKK